MTLAGEEAPWTDALRGTPAKRQATWFASASRSTSAGERPSVVFDRVRRIIYTTNAIESLHMQLRKIIKTRGHFPSEEAATKLIWLALRNVMACWSRAARQWTAALNQFALMYPDRFTRHSA